MAYYRRRRYTPRRRKTFGRKRSWRRNFKRRTFRYNKSGQKIHYFTRHVDLGGFDITNGTSATYASYTFELNQIHNYTDFTAMYDSYRIKAVKLTFIPVTNVTFRSNTSNLAVEGTAFSGRFFSCLDFNDSTTPSSVNQVREYKNAKWTPYTRIHKRFLYPKVLYRLDENVNVNATQPWIPTASANVEHYCVKVAFEHPSTSLTGTYYTIEAKFYLAFKSPK